MFVHLIVDENAECICIANEIEDGETGKRYYPDMLYRHNFKEIKMIGCEPSEVFRNALGSGNIHNIAIFKAPESAKEEILKWVGKITAAQTRVEELFDSREKNLILETAEKLRFTKAMSDEFVTLMKRYKIKNGDIEFLKQFLAVGVCTKNEVKAVYGSIKEHVAKSFFPRLY